VYSKSACITRRQERTFQNATSDIVSQYWGRYRGIKKVKSPVFEAEMRKSSAKPSQRKHTSNINELGYHAIRGVVRSATQFCRKNMAWMLEDRKASGAFLPG
jgi:hypothetical protein